MDKQLWIVNKQLEHRLTCLEQENILLRATLTLKRSKYNQLQDKLQSCHILVSSAERIILGERLFNISKRETECSNFSQYLQRSTKEGAYNEGSTFDSTIADGVKKFGRSLESRLAQSRIELDARRVCARSFAVWACSVRGRAAGPERAMDRERDAAQAHSLGELATKAAPDASSCGECRAANLVAGDGDSGIAGLGAAPRFVSTSAAAAGPPQPGPPLSAGSTPSVPHSSHDTAAAGQSAAAGRAEALALMRRAAAEVLQSGRLVEGGQANIRAGQAAADRHMDQRGLEDRCRRLAVELEAERVRARLADCRLAARDRELRAARRAAAAAGASAAAARADAEAAALNMGGSLQRRLRAFTAGAVGPWPGVSPHPCIPSLW